ncbi:MAG: PEP-CTERM sorting domain-containing protein [Planctomycetaceae bacterium]|nr:PEP-CTERM sorting domain-containing protein [Planctomycetaceae bacterium]
MNKSMNFLAASLVALSMVSAAQASVIWSEDFENPAKDGPYQGVYYLSNWIEQWGHLTADHVYKPTDAAFDMPLASPAGGEQVLWISQNGNWAARSGGLISANTVYTLSAAVGDFECDAVPFWRVQLWSGDANGPTNLLTEIAYDTIGANIPADRGWALNTVAFDSTGSSHVGETPWARLYTDPIETGADPGEFDNVVLQGSPVPEPSTCVIMLTGLLAMLLFARRNTCERS